MKEGLLTIKNFVIPRSILQETIEFLRQVGSEGFEGFVLWGGEASADSFFFKTSIIPTQRAILTPNGLLVTVEGEALFEVNKALHDQGQVLAAQVHSHPSDAYHSSTDDQFPMVTLMGALSIVIPDFARYAPQDLDDWAWYRLSKKGHWDGAFPSTSIEIV